MRLPRTTLITVTITVCILFSCLLPLAATAGACHTGDCSKHTGVVPADQEGKMDGQNGHGKKDVAVLTDYDSFQSEGGAHLDQ